MKKRIMRALLVALLMLNASQVTAGNPYSVPTGDIEAEPVLLRVTTYCDEGKTATGIDTNITDYHFCASRKEWIGKVIELNEVAEDGSIGEFIGHYVIEDVGYGFETGEGESSILNGKTKGSLELGYSIDVFCHTQHGCDEWIDTHGDYLYCKLISGN